MSLRDYRMLLESSTASISPAVKRALAEQAERQSLLRVP